MRRSVSRRAAEAGLGAVRRVHRQRRARPSVVQMAPGVPLLAVAVGAAAALDWRLVLLLPVPVWAGVACWVRLGPLPGGPRRTFAVCDGGILVLSQAETVAVPWDAPAEPVLDAKGRVLRLATGGGERRLDVGPVSAARDFGRAVAERAPVRPRVAPRLAAVAAGAAVLAFAGWTAQSWVDRSVHGERPEHLKDLARLCSRQDRPFERAAPYEGAGPHPLVFFRAGMPSPALATAGEGARRPAPDEVQLVACSYPAGRVSDTPVRVCPYEGGLRLESYQGRHRLDVFEARTGRRVGRRMLKGADEAGECASSQLVRGEPPHRTVREGETQPTRAAYEAALRPYLTGPRRS